MPTKEVIFSMRIFAKSKGSDNIHGSNKTMTDQRKHTLILGGGFAGLFTALELSGKGRVTLVCDEDHFLFTPMLYEYMSGEVEAWHIAPRFNELLNENDVRLIRDEVASIDLDAKQVTLKSHKDPLDFDVLVLSVGGVTNHAGDRKSTRLN